MNQLINNQALTMTSVELLAVINSYRVEDNKANMRHDNFMAKIKDEFEEDALKFKGSYLDNSNKESNCYNLPVDECFQMAMRESKSVRKNAVKKIRELMNSKPSWLTQLSPQATMAIEDLSKQLDQSHKEVDRLQGVCNTITAQFAVGMTPSKFAKQFNGCNVKMVNKSLVKLNMLQQSKEGYIPTSYSRDRYFKVTFEPYVNGEKEGVSAKTELTLAGAKWLYKAYLSGKLTMKDCWDGINSHVVFEGK